jgi:hypothetical protein
MNDTSNLTQMPGIERDNQAAFASFSRFGFIQGSGEWNHPYKWLVENLIPDKSIGFIGGAAASGKTFAAIDIMASAITGQSVLGRHSVKRCGVVIYCAVEGRQGIAHRFEAYRQSRNIDSDLWNSRLVQTDQLFRFTGTAAPDFIRYVHDIEKKLNDKVGLVVFDTFRTFSGMNDENGSGDAQEAINWMRQVAHKSDCSVIAIHHSGKNTGDPTRPGDDFNKVLRGSSDFGSSAEFVIGVAQAECSDGEARPWIWPAKLKDVKREPPRPAPIESFLLEIDGESEPLPVGVIASDIDPDIELADRIANPQRGQPRKYEQDAQELAAYACSGSAPAELEDMRQHHKRLCSERGVTNSNTIKGRFTKAMHDLERDPGKYGVEILTPYPDKNIKQYWRPESNWPAVK